MTVSKLFCFIFFCFFTSISVAQTGNKSNINNQTGYVQFTSDGATYGMKSAAGKEIKMTAELKYAGTTPVFLLALYTDPVTRDTLILYLYDDKGLPVNAAPVFSKSAKLLFIYKLFGKGIMTKALDNAKGEITAADFIHITKLESKPGGTVEGNFNFTDINFKNNAGKVIAKIRGINDGRFRTQITRYSEMTAAAKNETATSKTTGQLSAVAGMLFKNVKSKLTDADKNQIADMTGFVLVPQKDEPFAQDKESLDYPFAAVVTVTDMNKDGIEEVFIQFGNSYTSGAAGANIVLYIKNKQGKYDVNLGFPGVEPQQLKTGFGGYPDLLIGGPGMEGPVWRWNGKEYVYYKSMKF
ncbi:MAG: hypothetical protein ABI594_06955 [Ginsengibacter sp.]